MRGFRTMIRTLKRIAARLPNRWQQELKRRRFARQIRAGTFRTGEPEFEALAGMVSAGDWVLDVGANIGHYTLRLAELVGPTGRVIAFEPVPDTFEVLSANAALAAAPNITLINAAASDAAAEVAMAVPRSPETGLADFYCAQIGGEGGMGYRVLAFPIDAFGFPRPIRLIKIDAEGHELAVLRGMEALLRRDGPVVIVEDNDPATVPFLEGLGYGSERREGSGNRVYRKQL